MPEITTLNGCSDRIGLGFVERERTPELLLKSSIPLYETVDEWLKSFSFTWNQLI